MPWRNGLGTTLEIARDTPASSADFGWRLSLADVAQSGAFSPFAGLTRIISVIEGAGMRLHIDGVPTQALARWKPYVFSGAAQVSCELLDGPIRDLNLIYRADRYRAELDWVSVDGALPLAYAEAQVLFCGEGSLKVRHEQERICLGPLDALRSAPPPMPSELTIQGTGQLCVIRLHTLA
ncbi:HutD family protein [Pseudomonas oryzihabitans]|uniref:HutD family protein n=1 Tax=Pseudomonas oryzihabitans TaxID=47885 RepID=A0A2Z5A4T5_9PSED|nr:HutD family protein [Pseudomonas oryzihabitans]AXA65119.1 hypothetical protein CE139_04640 [Pseudomonas oryzihabitans]